MELEDLFRSKKSFSPKELAELLEFARASGKTAFVTFVDDPNTPEARAVKDYIDSHYLLPRNYEDTTELEIEEKGVKLLSPETPIAEKKEILILLAHLGVFESYRVLKKYRQNPDPELHIWAEMAFDECRTFVRQQFSEEALVAFSQIRKIGRNDPCPCGSGKKFKKCCGKELG